MTQPSKIAPTVLPAPVLDVAPAPIDDYARLQKQNLQLLERLERLEAANVKPALKDLPTYSTQRERLPHAENTMKDPLVVFTRQGSDRLARWARLAASHELSMLGYQSVAPDDVELIEGGSWEPKTKDFGLRIRFAKSDDIVQVGEMILMWCYKREQETRLKQEYADSLRLKPSKTQEAKAGEETFEESDAVSALKGEFTG